MSQIRKHEPCIAKFNNHNIKGISIGYGFNSIVNPITNTLIIEPICLDSAIHLLEISLIKANQDLINSFGSIYIDLPIKYKSAILNLCDLMGLELLYSKFKTSLYAICSFDFELSHSLMMKNYWTISHYGNSKRLQECLNDLR